MASSIATLKRTVAREGLAATASPAATATALQILAEGGNAIDAAVAAAWALCVCEPSGSGLGGHTVMLIRDSGGRVVGIDGQSCAPAAASLDTITRRGQRAGFRATTVPTTPAALGYAQKKFGALPPNRVFGPAIQLAEDGFVVSHLHRKQLAWTLTALRASPTARALLLRDGDLPDVGQRFRQPALAETLRRLAKDGYQDFYCGRIARRIIEDMEQNGGLINLDDLAHAANPVECALVSMNYRSYRVLSIGSPGGGTRLRAALQAMEHFWPDRSGDSADLWYHAIAKSRYSAFSGSEPALCAERFGETTHLCVADSEGNVVTLTQSIQSLFGAKVANAELGFLYNNYLCACPRSAHAAQLSSRCRPRSNAAPTLVLKNGAPFLAIGAAGSRRIISSILQTISGVIDRALPIQMAVAAPRIHALASGRIWIEAPAATESLVENLSKQFKGVKVRPALSFKMGAVQAIQFDGSGGAIGAADPRRDGVATSLNAER